MCAPIKKKLLLFLVAICVLAACPAYAGQATAKFLLRPEQNEQGGKVWYELVYESGTNSLVGAAFYLQRMPGVNICEVSAGEDVQQKEISYNVTDQKVTVLYLDEDGGDSGVQQGKQIVRICLQGDFKNAEIPFVLEKTDICAVDKDMNVIQVDGDLEIQHIQPEKDDTSSSQQATSQSEQSIPAEDSSINEKTSESTNTASEPTVQKVDGSTSSEDTLSSSSTSVEKEESEDLQLSVWDKNGASARRAGYGFLGVKILLVAVGIAGVFWYRNKASRK